MQVISLFSGIGGFEIASELMGFPPDWMLLPFLNGEQKALKEEETQ